MLIAIFSTLLYNYVKIAVLESCLKEMRLKKDEILTLASSGNESVKEILERLSNRLSASDITANLETNMGSFVSEKVERIEAGNIVKFRVSYVISRDLLLVITKDVSTMKEFLSYAFENIVIINIVTVAFVLFYAMFLSRILLTPIRTLCERLANLNERALKPIDDDIPLEFKPLTKDINQIIHRISNFLDYQKELFVGIAHELKTPLAVMKTKIDVTMLKPREKERYVEALRSNLESIEQINKMISSVLQLGRLEGVQFEAPVKTELNGFLRGLANDFAILARNEKKDVELRLCNEEVVVTIGRNLLLHIVQNFVQNAVKFSPEGGVVVVETEVVKCGKVGCESALVCEENLENGDLSSAKNGKLSGVFGSVFGGGAGAKSEVECKSEFLLRVIDSGVGIVDGVDIFAPFKRFGEKGGVGLGLFLAKSAADVVGAKLSVENRKDGKSGAVATLRLPLFHRHVEA